MRVCMSVCVCVNNNIVLLTLLLVCLSLVY